MGGIIQMLCGLILGHDFYNGGEVCRDCRAERRTRSDG